MDVFCIHLLIVQFIHSVRKSWFVIRGKTSELRYMLDWLS